MTILPLSISCSCRGAVVLHPSSGHGPPPPSLKPYYGTPCTRSSGQTLQGGRAREETSLSVRATLEGKSGSPHGGAARSYIFWAPAPSGRSNHRVFRGSCIRALPFPTVWQGNFGAAQEALPKRLGPLGRAPAPLAASAGEPCQTRMQQAASASGHRESRELEPFGGAEVGKTGFA